MIESLLHKQYHTDGDLVLFRCTECGFTSLSLGRLHSHAEKHRGFTRFGIQIPFTAKAPARVDKLMKLTEVIRVTNTEKISRQEVDGL